MTLTAEETAALELAVKALSRSGNSVEATHLKSLKQKILALVPRSQVARLETDHEALLEAQGLATRPGPRPLVVPEIASAVAEAIKACQILEIVYRTRGNEKPKPRRVAPYGILSGLRRYRKELNYLRPVTPDLVQELEARAPDSVGKAKEVICFAIRGYEQAGSTERVAVVAFGHDDICYVVDLQHDRGRDVERIPHRTDLVGLKATIARRRSKRRHQEGNSLAAQLLIRFVADINNKLPDRDHVGGAFLQFRDAWKVAGPMPDRTPTHAVKIRLKRGLQAIMRTDPDMPSSQDVKVHIHFESDSTLADYDDLRCHLLGNGEADLRRQGTFEIEKALLTERFMALAWLAFDEFQWGDLVNCYLDRIGDGARAGGWDSDPETWDLSCRIPSARSRRRAKSRFRKWYRRALVSFEQNHIEPAMSWLDGAIAGAKEGETRREKLAAWAKHRWQTANEGRLLALHQRLDRERSDDEHYIKSCKEEVGKYRRLADAFHNFATAPRPG